MNRPLSVKCPHCQTPFVYQDSAFRPFCSEKCRLVDLGHWLDGSYAVPVAPATPEEAQQLEDALGAREGHDEAE